MHRRERLVIYGALVLLGAVNVAALLQATGRAAHAAPGPAASGTLGPADTLALTGEGGDLLLRNRAGRLAWADSDSARAMSVGFVHLNKVLEPLLDSEKYVEDRERLQQEITRRDEEILGRMEAMRSQPDFNPASPDALQLGAEAEQWRVERVQRLGQLAASQIESAYRDLVAAVDVVADRRAIDLVYRYSPAADPLDAANSVQAYTAIRDRILLRSPATLDITDAVLEELAIQSE